MIVYPAGGSPTALRATSALWRRHVLDIDLLMIAAAMPLPWSAYPSRGPCC